VSINAPLFLPPCQQEPIEKKKEKGKKDLSEKGEDKAEGQVSGHPLLNLILNHAVDANR